MTQLAFGFGPRTSLARADFIEADCNALALAWVEAPARWPAGRLVLHGPPGSGRSHLAAIFAAARGAPVLAGPALSEAAIPELLPATGHAAIEAADQAPARPLLHLLNLAAERRGFVLLTAPAPAAAWGTALPDLRSRLAASGSAALGIPEDGLVRAVLAKEAAARQFRLPHAVAEWLLARLPRDLSAAAAAVAALDAASLAAGRAPDIRLARLVLPAFAPAGADEIPMTDGAEGSRPVPPLL